MRLKNPDIQKLLKSAGIVFVTTGILLAFKWGFPDFNWSTTETIILTSVGTWLVNTVKESVKWEQ